MKPEIIVEPPGPKAQEILKRWSSCGSRASKLETSFVKGSGVYLEDIDGNTFMDFTSDGETCLIGYSHPRVVSAVKEQVEKTGSTALRYAVHELKVSLAEQLKSIAPGQLSNGKVAFCNTGSDATEFAMKMARVHTNRIALLAYLGCHHGLSIGALSLTSDHSKARSKCLPLIPEIAQIPYPYCFRCPLHNSYPECGLACFDYIQYTLDRLVDPQDVAALFMESIQQVAGVIVPPPEYFAKVKGLCKKHGILLVDDEVATGFGRTGKMFAIEHWNIEPDMMYMAKPVASGLSMGVIMARKEIMDLERKSPVAVGGGFEGNLLSCASALANLEVIREENLPEKASSTGNYLFKRLSEMSESYGFIGDIRGKGLMIGIEMIKDDKLKTPDSKKASEVTRVAFKKGLILANIGTYQQVVRITPALNITRDEIDMGLNILEEALRQVSS